MKAARARIEVVVKRIDWRRKSDLPPRRRKQSLDSSDGRRNANEKPIAIIIILFAALICLIMLATDRSSRRLTYAVNSDHPGIKSLMERHDIGLLRIEKTYPSTARVQINRIVRRGADGLVQNLQALSDCSGANKARIEVDYLLPHFDNSVLSVLAVARCYSAGKIFSRTRSWTFDYKTGRILSLADLTGSTEATQNIANRLEAQLKYQLGENYNSKRLTSKQLKAFVIEHKRTLTWRFAEGEAAPAKLGEIKVKLDLDRWAKQYFTTEIAKKVLDLDNLPQSTLAATGDCSQHLCIALSFDDGPSEHTNDLLQTLAKSQVKASFFTLGINASRYPDVVKRLAAEGHEAGIHTWSHFNLNRLSSSQINHEIESSLNLTHELTGSRPVVMRPPFGIFSDLVSQIAKNHNLALVLWSIDPHDWKTSDSQTICNHVLAHAHRNGIILMHDVYGQSVAAVGCIVDGLSQRGFRIVTVGELFNHQLVPGQVYYRR